MLAANFLNPFPFPAVITPRYPLALLLAILILPAASTLPAMAERGRGGGGTHSVNWTTLNLSPDQESEFQRLEDNWKKLYSELHPQIIRDKTELRRLLNAPQSDERRIMELQDRINGNEERLRNEATRCFLHKKNRLNPNQRVRLQQLLSE